MSDDIIDGVPLRDSSHQIDHIEDDVKILSMAMEKYVLEGRKRDNELATANNTIQTLRTDIVEMRQEVMQLKKLVSAMGQVLMQTKTEMEEVKHNTENDTSLHEWMYEESFQDTTETAVSPREIIRGAELRKERSAALSAERSRDDRILRFHKRFN